MIERYSEAKARRIGQVAMIGGKDKTKIRNATPTEFRDVLLRIARTARSNRVDRPGDTGRDSVAQAQN